MRSKVMLAGVALAAVLTVLAVVGALLQWWWLVVAAVMVLLGTTLVIALDADRRVRALRSDIRAEVGASGGAVEVAPPVTDADVIGAVRVLQAQYTGRLDRMQTSLDRALAQLRSQQEGTREAGGDGT